jgi:adenosylmethionine-8-amino-7-oxononanoate aminotransferase
MSKGYFITATDTGVGKTVVTLVLGALWRQKGVDVGVMKPVQCAGDDASRLVNALDVRDEFDLVNPYYADEPLSPHAAFARVKRRIIPARIMGAYRKLSARHEIMLVEGAGGLMVPLSGDYFIADLARDLNLPLIIVARLGLGTINHTLLTIRQARDYGLEIAGVIFSRVRETKAGAAEATGPAAIEKIGEVPVLGTVPYLEKTDQAALRRECRGLIRLPEPEGGLSRPARRTRILRRWDKEYVWHPFTQMKDWMEDEPLVIDRGRGSYLIDTDGNKYIDGVSSLWVNTHGHRHPAVDRAVKDQLGRVAHSTLLGLANTPSVELARRLAAIAPRGLEKVFYSDNGSTAVEVAIKLAYQYWQNAGQTRKTKIVHMANSYHGDTLGSVSVGGIDLFHKIYQGLVFEAERFTFPEGGVGAGLGAFDGLLRRLKGRVAAFVTEPGVQGAAGMLVWPDGLLKGMAEVCRKHDVLLIVDEVATGFGRTGTMFACEQEDVAPDFLCLAKGLTAGYLPLAATLVSRKIYEGFLFDYKDLKTFFHGHTYTGNPLACAAALANLRVFSRERVLRKLQPRIKQFSRRLEKFYNLAAVGEVRRKGFMAGIELVRGRESREPYPLQEKIGARVCRRARELGVILRPLGNVIVLMPPLSISQSELDQLLDAAYGAIEQVTKQPDGKT